MPETPDCCQKLADCKDIDVDAGLQHRRVVSGLIGIDKRLLFRNHILMCNCLFISTKLTLYH